MKIKLNIIWCLMEQTDCKSVLTIFFCHINMLCSGLENWTALSRKCVLQGMWCVATLFKFPFPFPHRNPQPGGVVFDEVRTVLMSTHCDGKTGWPITDASACQHPDAIFCPPLEFVQHERRGVEGDRGSLRVRTPTLHDQQLVVYDATIAALCRWWVPWYTDWCWTHCFPSHVLGGCPGHYSWGGRDTTHFNTTQVT